MRVFVIGGTGFLGTHLLRKLLDHGHDVTVLTRSREKASGSESLGIKGVKGKEDPKKWLDLEIKLVNKDFVYHMYYS